MTFKQRLDGLAGRFGADRKTGLIACGLLILVGASVALAATQGGSGPSAVTAAAQAPDAQYSSDPERAKIERVVREYLIAHPEVLQEAADAYRDRQLAGVIKDNQALFETPFGNAWAGADDGDVVLVEFFDYACGFCRASNADVDRLLKEDPKLKVVWREFPVLGPDSISAAQASLAAAKQGRFRQFYDKMFAAGTPSPDKIASAQKASGATPLESVEIQREIERNYELARAVGFSGTPAFVVGGKVLQGAVGYKVLKQAIEEARAQS